MPHWIFQKVLIIEKPVSNLEWPKAPFFLGVFFFSFAKISIRAHIDAQEIST